MSDEHGLTPGQVGEGFRRHAQAPCNLGELAQPSGRARAVGVCGDAIQMDLGVKDEVITEVRVMPHGCVYTTVCASAMGELALGLRLDQALELAPVDVETALGGLPEDHLHCARLAVNTLGEAIADYYARSRLNGPGLTANAERI